MTPGEKILATASYKNKIQNGQVLFKKYPGQKKENPQTCAGYGLRHFLYAFNFRH